MILRNGDDLGRGGATGDPVHRPRDTQVLLGVIRLLGQVEGPHTKALVETVVANQTGLKTTERGPVIHPQFGFGAGHVPDAKLVQIADEPRSISTSSHPGIGEPGTNRCLVQGFVAQLTVDVNADLGPVISGSHMVPCVDL